MQRATLTGIIGLAIGFLVGSFILPMNDSAYVAMEEAYKLMEERYDAMNFQHNNLVKQVKALEALNEAMLAEKAEINAALAHLPVAETPLDEVRVLEIAKRALAENDTWSDPLRFEVEPEGKGWSVFVARLPQVPGGHRMIKIDAAGKVTDYHRGE